MAKPDIERAFANRQLEIQAADEHIVLLATFRDTQVTSNDGIDIDLPSEMTAKCLGPAEVFADKGYFDFVIWNPNKMAIQIFPFEAMTELSTEVTDRMTALNAAGWITPTISYPDRTIILAHRLRYTTSPADHTSE